MFLPALLLRDYGAASWWIFAVPNVVGAAAMGMVLAGPGVSAAMQQRHRTAMVTFSLVTLAFQVYFMSWVIPRMAESGYWIAGAAGALLVVYRMARHSVNLRLIAAGLVWVFSAGVMVYWLLTAGTGGMRGLEGTVEQYAAWPALPGLAMVCLFGFLLCPYLDLSFHEARQRLTAVQARWAFGLGFGVFFLAMIVFTAMYSGEVLRHLTPERVTAAAPVVSSEGGALGGELGLAGNAAAAVDVADGVSGAASGALTAGAGPGEGLMSGAGSVGVVGVGAVLLGLLMVHLVVQAGTTLFIHFERTMSVGGMTVKLFGLVALCMVGAYGAARLMGAAGTETLMSPWGVSWLEWGYIMLMSAYGVCFPAYVWIVMVGGREPNRANLIRWGAAVLGGGFCFWLGFIEGLSAWLIPGVVWMVMMRWLPLGSGVASGPAAVDAGGSVTENRHSG